MDFLAPSEAQSQVEHRGGCQLTRGGADAAFDLKFDNLCPYKDLLLVETCWLCYSTHAVIKAFFYLLIYPPLINVFKCLEYRDTDFFIIYSIFHNFVTIN